MRLTRLLAALSVAAPLPAMATNGLQLPGFGTCNIGMGGAGIAFACDSTAAANNPAGMGLLESRLDVGMNLLFADVKTTVGPQQTNINPFVPIPSAGFNWAPGGDWTYGVSVYGYGVGLNYGRPLLGFGLSKTRSDLKQVVVAPTVTYKIAPGHVIGVSPQVALQRFGAGGLQLVGLNNPGYDYSAGAGARIGWIGEVAKGWRLGATYQSPITMTALSKYRGLLADRGRLDVPQEAGVGVSVDLTPALTVALDYLWINWSSIRPLGNEFPGTGPLGSKDGAGFGWRDQHVGRLGFQYKLIDALTLRTGFSAATALFPSSQTAFNVTAPLAPNVHLTGGATYKFSPSVELSFAVTHSLDRIVRGTGPSTGVNTGGNITNVQFGLGYKF